MYKITDPMLMNNQESEWFEYFWKLHVVFWVFIGYIVRYLHCQSKKVISEQ